MSKDSAAAPMHGIVNASCHDALDGVSLDEAGWPATDADMDLYLSQFPGSIQEAEALDCPAAEQIARAARDCTRITSEDLRFTINARADDRSH